MFQSFAVVFIIFTMNCITGKMMTGGWSNVADVNTPSFQKYVDFATSEISARSNSLHHLKTIEVLSARKQVVSGMNYEFTMRIGPTECKKNEKNSDFDLNKCEFLSCEPTQICNATVWSQAWRETKDKLTKHSCKQEPRSC